MSTTESMHEDMNVSAQGSPSETVPQLPAQTQSDVSSNRKAVVDFVESTPSPMITFADNVDGTFCADSTDFDDLKDFLSRPVNIASYTWTEGSPSAQTTLSPWYLFLNHPVIKKKIDNYAFMNFKLHIKAIVNASPFYYGALLFHYVPLPAFGKAVVANLPYSFIPYSQRPHYWIFPQCNQGGEMVLPFFYYKNWLDITSSADVTAMGTLYIDEVVALANANGATGGNLNIQIYCWASEVKMTGPTVKTSLQSGKWNKKDEYGQGPVSRPASFIASIANRLGDVPVIGVYAKATEIGASAVSRIATLFGFTNVPVIDNIAPMKNMPFPQFASANIGAPIEKLTLDPKNELSVDPRTVGLGEGDELSIAYLAGKESLLAICDWDTTLPPPTKLFYSAVTPSLFNRRAETYGYSYYMTPMCMLAQIFKYWRGDIVFRIKAICTQYHKGRLRLTWDPVGNIAATSDTTTSSYTKIVDLSPDLDMQVRCSYLQARHWLTTQQIQDTLPQFDVTGGLFPNWQNKNFNNGGFSIQILNELTSPVTTSDVKILVFVRGCENLEFNSPYCETRNLVSHFAAQAGGWERMSGCESMSTGSVATRVPQEALIYHGEQYDSVRPLLRRTVFERAIPLVSLSTTTSALQVITINRAKWPQPYGFVSSASTDAVKFATGNAPFSYSRFSAYEYVVPCFVGMRGAIHRSYNLDTTNATDIRHVSSLRVDEVSEGVPVSGGRLVEIQSATTGYTTYSGQTAFYRDAYTAGISGTSLTNQNGQVGCQVSHPHFYPYRFCGTNPANQIAGIAEDDTAYHYLRVSVALKPSGSTQGSTKLVLEEYYSIGTDFTVFFFLNVPVVYSFPSVPGAP